MEKYPLLNTETKSIPIGPRLKGALKNQRQIPKEPSAPCDLAAPHLYTSNKILQQIQQIDNKNPNISLLVEQKLNSPNTAKYLRKKKTRRVNKAESECVYRDLVSASLSPTGFVRRLEEDLRRKAMISQPIFGQPDSEPNLEDYIQFDDNVHVRTVGHSDIFHQTTGPYNATPFQTTHCQVMEDCDHILN